MLSQEFIEARKKQLEEMLAHIQTVILSIVPHTELSENDLDVDASVLEEELDDAARAELKVLLDHKASIQRALARIAKGTYGFVISDDGMPTGEAIPEARLVSVPDAETLVDDE